MAQGGNQQRRERTAVELARELIVFADGAEEAGLIMYARKARVVARETLWLLEVVENERAARQTIQADRDRCLQLLANRAGQAARNGT